MYYIRNTVCEQTIANMATMRNFEVTPDISQADLQKVFANKIKRVQACTDARGHHLQHLL
jgi:hypothetical protein